MNKTAELILLGLGLTGMFGATLGLGMAIERKHGNHDHQARQWIVTLDQSKRASGQPWQAEISATSYDRARATARERFSWADDTFSVSPVVENYLDVRQVRITP